MDPWKIIGWAIIAVALAWITAVSIPIIMAFSARWILHLSTRRTPPMEGQEWSDWSGTRWLVGERYPAGHFYITTGPRYARVSLPYTDEEWKHRLKIYRMYLVKDTEVKPRTKR